ncbi:hypothetical protein M9Y10_009645 [Tritrichomonas musculus]|uniref:Proteasome assembly chaperone 3 n=1 Tax=Tritrichomonas musculus TaxID=1915356 RepID=A0ABR2IQQ9_9EUKA
MGKVIQLQVGEFEVAVSFYDQNAIIVIHNSIPGVGQILYTENDGKHIDIDQFIGENNQYLNLFVTHIAKMFSTRSITFILSFHPSKMSSFDAIKDFTSKFAEAVKKSSPE